MIIIIIRDLYSANFHLNPSTSHHRRHQARAARLRWPIPAHIVIFAPRRGGPPVVGEQGPRQSGARYPRQAFEPARETVSQNCS